MGRYLIIVFVDGKQHYAEDNLASPKKYAETVSEDRKLRLLGYDVYRFSGYELDDNNGKEEVQSFFEQLFDKHRVQLASAT